MTIARAGLLLVSVLASCGAFRDLDAVKPGGDAAADTDADGDSDADGDADADADADTDGDSDSCDTGGPDCAALGWECGAGENECGTPLDCDAEIGCAAEGEECAGHACVPCDTAASCGALCDPCPDTAPLCWAPVAEQAGTCVECLDDADCRGEEAPAPLDSPLGQCTPDHTCTCWVDPEDADPPRWICSTQAECDEGPGSDHYCARDFVSGFHTVCLRSCSVSLGPIDGMACEVRETAEDGNQLVWAPMTTCFAFDAFGLYPCAGVDDCSVDGSGSIADGSCIDEYCTYPCTNDDWCIEADPGCGDTAPYSGMCVP